MSPKPGHAYHTKSFSASPSSRKSVEEVAGSNLVEEKKSPMRWTIRKCLFSHEVNESNCFEQIERMFLNIWKYFGIIIYQGYSFFLSGRSDKSAEFVTGFTSPTFGKFCLFVIFVYFVMYHNKLWNIFFYCWSILFQQIFIFTLQFLFFPQMYKNVFNAIIEVKLERWGHHTSLQ